MQRRAFIAGGLALPFAGASRSGAQTQPIYVSDMHFHSYVGAPTGPVGKAMAEGQVTLLSWSLVGDSQWIERNPPHKQTSVPKPGEAMAHFQQVLGRVKAHAAEQKLKIALRPADVDAALRGEPHVVLSVEGATFVDDPAHVQVAYDLGVRHLQLVHYTKSVLGDFQTEAPVHNGLTSIGKAVVAECNRLGILVDLAHCTPAAIATALAISKAPVISSHGSVTGGPEANWKMITWKARQLNVAQARAIAKTGGVVGLWALRPDVGETAEAYGARLLEMAEWIGDEHVAFGTDMNGLGQFAMMRTYADVRSVIGAWQTKGVPERRIRRMASENYARVLKSAMQARTV